MQAHHSRSRSPFASVRTTHKAIPLCVSLHCRCWVRSSHVKTDHTDDSERKNQKTNRLSEWNNPLNRHETINILDSKCFRPVDEAPPSLNGPCLALQMWGKHHTPPSLALLSSLSGEGMAVSVSSPAEHYWGRSSSPVCASEWVSFKPACVCDGAGPDGLSGKSFGRSPRT